MTPKLFHSVEDLHRALKSQTVQVAIQAGFDVDQAEENGESLFGKHASDEAVRIYPNGSWAFEQDSEEKMTGENANMLGFYLIGSQEIFDQVFKET